MADRLVIFNSKNGFDNGSEKYDEKSIVFIKDENEPGIYTHSYGWQTLPNNAVANQILSFIEGKAKWIDKDYYTKEEVEGKLEEVDVTEQLAEYPKTSEVESMIETAKSEIIGGASGDYDTLQEIETWVTEHQDLYQALISTVASKATIEYVDEKLAELDEKYQPVGDYLTEVPETYATKEYVDEKVSELSDNLPQPDWNAEDGEEGYIKNKPFGTKIIEAGKVFVVGESANDNNGNGWIGYQFDCDLHFNEGEKYHIWIGETGDKYFGRFGSILIEGIYEIKNGIISDGDSKKPWSDEQSNSSFIVNCIGQTELFYNSNVYPELYDWELRMVKVEEVVEKLDEKYIPDQFITREEVERKIEGVEAGIPELIGYATESYVDGKIEEVEQKLFTKEEVQKMIDDSWEWGEY